METSVVHLVRHGQVYNPDKVLYGRQPGFGLSDLGHQMAERLGSHFRLSRLVHLVSSPLQRAQETMAPIAAVHPELPVLIDERVIEAPNYFEGRSFGNRNAVLFNPRHWWMIRNPLEPSWGEPYTSIVARMRAAMSDAAAASVGGEAVIVAHELPIWMARSWAEGRRLPHDPRKRQVGLASVTSFTFAGDQIIDLRYTEPCADLVPVKTRRFRPGA